MQKSTRNTEIAFCEFRRRAVLWSRCEYLYEWNPSPCEWQKKPIVNIGIDFWNSTDCLQPHLLGTRQSWCLTGLCEVTEVSGLSVFCNINLLNDFIVVWFGVHDEVVGKCSVTRVLNYTWKWSQSQARRMQNRKQRSQDVGNQSVMLCSSKTFSKCMRWPNEGNNLYVTQHLEPEPVQTCYVAPWETSLHSCSHSAKVETACLHF